MKTGYSEEKNICHVVCVWAIVLIGFAYISSLILFVTYEILHPFIRVCYHDRPEAAKDSDPIIIALIGLPYDLVTLITICMDIRTFQRIRKQRLQVGNNQDQHLQTMSQRHDGTQEQISHPNHNQQNQTGDILEIPLKATIMSTLAAIPGITIAFMLHALSLSFNHERYVVNLIILAVTSLRMPLIMSVTFRRNALNQAIDQETAREKKRQIEVFHALQSRGRKKVDNLS